jgi:hypothetical protein
MPIAANTTANFAEVFSGRGLRPQGAHFGLAGDLSGQLRVGQNGTGEDRELLPATSVLSPSMAETPSG